MLQRKTFRRWPRAFPLTTRANLGEPLRFHDWKSVPAPRPYSATPVARPFPSAPRIEDGEENGGPRPAVLVAVGKLIDGSLGDLDYARLSDDGLYRPVDVYLKPIDVLMLAAMGSVEGEALGFHDWKSVPAPRPYSAAPVTRPLPSTARIEGGEENGGPRPSILVVVEKLIDGSLGDPDYARLSDDGLYKPVDVYLK
ncbi:hypothetical protein U1Q18_033761, partial [Sarracenia purpurea var. burkii]